MEHSRSDDPVLAKARAAFEAARREADAWAEWIGRYEALLRDGGIGGAGNNVASRSSPVGTPRPTSLAVQETVQRVEQIIRSKNQPIPARLLRKYLEDEGFVIGGKDPANTLAARLSRATNLINIRDRGYWIRGIEAPAETSASASDRSVELLPPHERQVTD
jgi:hypothetical protein